MSYADKLFAENCRNIIDNGTDTKGQKVRPHWHDGESAYTVKQFGVVNRYDLRKEFPAMTFRRTALKSCMKEILWIYQKKSNNINDLGLHIWDDWADEDGSLGTTYGYTIGEKFIFKGNETDQMDYVLWQLANEPFSRRIMTNMYQYKNLATGHLDPCAYSMTYNVTEEDGKLVLNAILNQRSQDMLAASNWNVCQYAILLMMVAQVSNMIPGELIHVTADQHIYDRHIPIVEELIKREQFEAPIVKLNPDVKNFYDFTIDDLIVENYVYGDQVEFEVAI